MSTHWYTSKFPPDPGFYLVTVRRPNGSRFVGYAFFDGEIWLTANKKFELTLDILAWAFKPDPYDGPIKQSNVWG